MPIKLSDDLAWINVNVFDPLEMKDLYTLLRENYVEDLECLFRFDYQPQFLLWALTSPGWSSTLHLGVRHKETGQLVAFISAIPIHVKTCQA